MKKRWIALFGLVLGIVALTAGPAFGEAPQSEISSSDQPVKNSAADEDMTFEYAALDDSCFALRVCTWRQTHYGGARRAWACEQGIHWATAGDFRSAKNRCGNRRVWLIRQNVGAGSPIYVVCMNPGGNRPNPGWFNGIQVGVVGLTCP